MQDKIQRTPEFERIAALPRVDWREHVTRNDGYLRLTTALRTPQGVQTLRPIQAAALAYMYDYGGAFCSTYVGSGKTLLSFLAPTVLYSERPALLIPAALRAKTWREFQKLFQNWFGHTAFMRKKTFDVAVFNYEEISRENGRKRFLEYNPDLVIADEAQLLKNRDAACTKCVSKHMFDNHGTRFVALTGTPTTRSPMDFWHIMFWCLRHHMPMPRVQAEAEVWAESVSEKKSIVLKRPDATLLHQFLTPEQYYEEARASSSAFAELELPLRLARRAFGERFSSTPGIVSAEDPEIPCSLQLEELRWTPSEQAREWLAVLRATKKTPNGVELQLPTEVWRTARQMACDFWYRWDPPPPEEWLEKRKAYGWYLRNILLREGLMYHEYQSYNLYSPKDVSNAILQGRIHDQKVCNAYHAWIAVRDTYKHKQIAEWLGDDIVQQAARWLSANGGIVWTEHIAFGKRLSEVFGTGFCSADGVDKHGKLIDDYNGKPVIASVQANHKGRNLQAWNKNLGVTLPPNGAILEQLIGRTHRPGQLHDSVYFGWVNACVEQKSGFEQALADAQYIETTTKQKQKLNYADHL